MYHHHMFMFRIMVPEPGYIILFHFRKTNSFPHLYINSSFLSSFHQPVLNILYFSLYNHILNHFNMPVCCSSKVVCKSGCCDPCCDPCCGPCCGSGCGCGSCCSSGCGCGSCCDSCCDPCCAPCCVRKKTTVTKTVCYRPVVKVVKKTVCCKTCPRVCCC